MSTGPHANSYLKRTRIIWSVKHRRFRVSENSADAAGAVIGCVKAYWRMGVSISILHCATTAC
jgi:hypothetical protein